MPTPTEADMAEAVPFPATDEKAPFVGALFCPGLDL